MLTVITKILLRYKRLYLSHWKVINSDIHIISFPKAGRTWLRMLIGVYLNKKFNLDIDSKNLSLIQKFNNFSEQIPKFSVTHWADPQFKYYKDVKIPTFFLRNKPLIFLIRDPFDVSKSFYHQFYSRGAKLKAWNESKFSEKLEEFIFGDFGGFKSVIQYHKSIKSLQNNYKGKILIIKYEDLKINPKNKLCELLNFINIEIDENIVLKAVNFSTKDNLSILEKSGLLNDYHFGGKGQNAKVRTESDLNAQIIEKFRVKYIEMKNEDPFYG